MDTQYVKRLSQVEMNAQLASWQNMALERVPQYLAGHNVSWVAETRAAAFARFKEHGFPTRGEEDWKYTDVSVIGKRTSLAPDSIPPAASSEALLLAWTLAQEDVHLMVFVNGHFSDELSAPGGLPSGIQLVTLAGLLDRKPGLLEWYFDQSHEHTVFAALNNALMTDGVALMLAPETILLKPVYLLFIASGQGSAIYPRNVVVAGKNSRAIIIEHYFGMLEAHNFTNSITQISLDAGAALQHCKLIQEGSAACHIGGIHAEQAAGSRFDSHSFALGGRLVSNDITSCLSGEKCQCTFDGLYMLEGKQHADHHTRIDHFAPSCISREHYRGIMDGESHGVFNGKVVVHPHAINTDAHQSNHNLLLSRQAEIDTKPQLEIFADEVKCTHGATVGQLDDDSLFYLRARGIDGEAARSLLIYGFASDIIGRVNLPNMQARIERLVLNRLPQGEQIKEML
jgi:Fe-S cluster assembly protein SufD